MSCLMFSCRFVFLLNQRQDMAMIVKSSLVNLASAPETKETSNFLSGQLPELFQFWARDAAVMLESVFISLIYSLARTTKGIRALFTESTSSNRFIFCCASI